jgi:hypothetical protein
MASQRPPEWYPIPAICIYVGCISSGLADELTATLLRLIEASPGLRARIRLAQLRSAIEVPNLVRRKMARIVVDGDERLGAFLCQKPAICAVFQFG